MQMAIDDLPGRSVLDSTGRVVGQVDGFVVDTESWAINSLRVRLRRAAAADMGLSWSPFRATHVDVPTGLVLAASDAVILRAALEELQGLVAAPPSPVAA